MKKPLHILVALCFCSLHRVVVNGDVTFSMTFEEEEGGIPRAFDMTSTKDTNLRTKRSLVVELETWMQLSYPTSLDPTTALIDSNDNLRHELNLQFQAHADLASANTTLESIQSTITGNCEEEYTALINFSCFLVDNVLEITYTVDNNNVPFESTLLEDTTRIAFQEAAEQLNQENSESVFLQVRSPIPVETKLSYLFHNVESLLGDAELNVVYSSFYAVFAGPLSQSQPTSFLSGVELVKNILIDEDNNRRRRRLHLRPNEHVHQTLLVELRVQANCHGVACTHPNFQQMLDKLAAYKRQEFQDTILRKGRFSRRTDYFDDLTHIDIYNGSLPTFVEDTVDGVVQPPSADDDDEGTPTWFVVVAIILAVLLVIVSILLTFVARDVYCKTKTLSKKGNTPDLVATDSDETDELDEKKKQLGKNPSEEATNEEPTTILEEHVFVAKLTEPPTQQTVEEVINTESFRNDESFRSTSSRRVSFNEEVSILTMDVNMADSQDTSPTSTGSRDGDDDSDNQLVDVVDIENFASLSMDSDSHDSSGEANFIAPMAPEEQPLSTPPSFDSSALSDTVDGSQSSPSSDQPTEAKRIMRRGESDLSEEMWV